MQLWIAAVIVLLTAGSLCGQSKDPYTLGQMIGLWEDSDFKAAEVLAAIDNGKLVIEFSEWNLASIFEGAQKGKRSPHEIAQVMLRLLKDCRNCRDQFWAALDKDTLLAALAKGPTFAMEELNVRGARNLPESTDFIDKLVAAGASAPLVAAVEDKLQMSVPEGFKPMPLTKAPEFDPLAKEGKLRLHVKVEGEAVFLFRHNALFVKTLKGAEPTDMGSSFTAFGPAADNPAPKWPAEVLPKGAKKPRKPVPTVAEVVKDSTGRAGLQLVIKNDQKDKHEYDLEIRWKR